VHLHHRVAVLGFDEAEGDGGGDGGWGHLVRTTLDLGWRLVHHGRLHDSKQLTRVTCGMNEWVCVWREGRVWVSGCVEGVCGCAEGVVLAVEKRTMVTVYDETSSPPPHPMA
jgi:hypothetical protein